MRTGTAGAQGATTPAGPGGRARSRGLAFRIALAALVAAGLGVGVVALGVLIVGGELFEGLMRDHGESAIAAHAMFNQSVSVVLVSAGIAGVVAASLLAMVVGRRLAAPLRHLGWAARRVANGDYAVRVAREGPDEIVGLIDSFNQMAASLQEQERMRREFVANASHELRTPLTNLQGYLEALRDGVIEADRSTYVSLLEEADRLVRLARSLDTLAAGDAASGPPRVVELDLAGAVRTACSLAAPAFDRAGIRVRQEVPDALDALGDPDGVAQVLANLLQNASRYAPSGSEVVVRAEGRVTDALVSVSSGGEPIPATDVPHLFERFYRVDKSRDRAHGGAGIGLAIVRQLVEAAGGQVGVDSRPGLNRFWFTLPVRAAARH